MTTAVQSEIEKAVRDYVSRSAPSAKVTRVVVIGNGPDVASASAVVVTSGVSRDATYVLEKGPSGYRVISEAGR